MRARTPYRIGLLASLLVLVAALAAPASAQQPIEGLGTGQSRLTAVGTDGDGAIDALNPSIAYDSTRNQYFFVWQQQIPATTRIEIFGQRMDSAGHPIGSAKQISEAGAVDATLAATASRVVYSPQNDRFIVAFDAEITGGDREVFARLVNPASGDPEGTSVQVSDMDPATGSGFAGPPVIAIDTGSTANQVRFAWQGNGVSGVDNAEIWSRRMHVDLSDPTAFGQIALTNFANDSASQPALAFVPNAATPTAGHYALAFTADETGLGDFEVYAALSTLGSAGTAAPISNAGTNQDSVSPDIARGNGELLVVFQKDALRAGTSVTRRQLFAQRLNETTLAEPVDESQITNVFEGVSGLPALAYDSAQDRYLTAFAGAAVSGKNEIYSQALDDQANPLATDDAQLSLTPPAENPNGDATVPALAAGTANRRWMAVWQADSLIAPLTDNEFEIYGRLVGENFDRDNDGYATNGSPADCNDADAAINPGATEILDNGVDENCDGVAATTPIIPPPSDRDGDGIPDASDKCPDQKRGDSDRDNDGCPGPFPSLRANITLTANILGTGRFRIRSIKVTVPKGSKVAIKCVKGCKKKQTRTAATLTFKRFKNLRVKKGAVIEIRATRANFNGVYRKYTFTKSNFKKTDMCIPAGKTKPVRVCR